jgi:hypothetical protein
MGLRRGIFITTVIAAFFAAAPDVYHACAQVDGTSGASSVASSGNTEKALHVLVYEPLTKTIAPDKAEVKFSVYDTSEKTVTELTRATLPDEANLNESRHAIQRVISTLKKRVCPPTDRYPADSPI